MKKSFFILLCLCANFLLSAQSSKTIKPLVQKAIVYQQGAQLFASETVMLPSGTSEIIFENVSPYLEPSSLQANCKGNPVVMDVRYTVRYSEAEKTVDKTMPEATIKRYERDLHDIRDSLKELEFVQYDLNNRVQNLDNERNILTQNKMVNGNLQRDSLSLFLRALEYYRARVTVIDAEKVKISRENWKVYLLKTHLEKRMSDTNVLLSGRPQNSGGTKTIPQIIVTIMSDVAVSSEVSVNYFVNNAGWTPSYDLRATKESPLVELKHRASVFQNTGIDWKNVSLVLSTGNPNQTNEKPTLQPFFIGFEQAQVIAYGYGAATTVKKETYGKQPIQQNNLQNGTYTATPTSVAPMADYINKNKDGDGIQDAELNPYINVNNNLLRVEYDITLKYSIDSDGKPRNVVIQSKNIPANYIYSVVPKLDPDVFLMAQITDWEDMNLVQGTARIYFDNSFVGESFINPRGTNDTMQLNFGRDKSIVVTRTKIKDKCKEKFMNDNKFSAKTYEIVVRNTKSTPIRIMIEDQMPVTKEQDIKIDYTENSNATKFNPETGKVTWDLNIKSKDSKKLIMSYEVKHPKDKIVTGL